MRVTVGRAHFDDVVPYFEYRNVEGAAAKVEDGDLFIFLLIKSVGESRRSGFIDDALHIKPGDLTRIARGLALRVVEVCRHCDDRLRNTFSKLRLGILLQFLQDHRRDFLRAILLISHFHLNAAVCSFLGLKRHCSPILGHICLVKRVADEPFDLVDGVLGIGHALPPREKPHEALASL